MKAYILAIAGAVILSAVVTVIAPGGKMGKFVRGTAKLLILLVMLSPAAAFFGGKGFSFPAGELSAEDGGYIERCASLMEEGDAREISAYLGEAFGAEGEVKTERERGGEFALRKITVKITGGGIFGQDSHINIVTEIREALEKRYGCEAEVSCS